MALLDHLEKLRHFSGVVRAGSIRGYATTHRLSQPAISKTIRILEAELETTLLIRSKDGVCLTPAGDDLLRLADEVLEGSKSAEQRIRSRGNVQLEGRFVLGTYQSIAVYFLPKFFRYLDFAQKNVHSWPRDFSFFIDSRTLSSLRNRNSHSSRHLSAQELI
jgi:DNA-binding transcriptional LysR family regulator